MDLGIKGRKALVIGASKGIGRAVCLGLAAEGVQVAAVARTEADLLSLLSQMGGEKSGHCVMPFDLMPDGAPTRMVLTLAETIGSADIVVHSLGGTMGVVDPLSPVKEWRMVWRFNLEIALEVNRLLIPPMQERQWGRVLHVSSIAAVRGRASLPYTTIKAALNGYVSTLGRCVAADGVVVTAVMPGVVRTKGGHWDSVFADNPECAEKYLEDRIAVKRFGTPEEVRDMIVFLCSERASFFAGALIPIDGGTW